MRAELLIKERLLLSENMFVEVVLWRVPEPVLASMHDIKYRLALVVNGACVLRYDNEAGKGDHKHIGDREVAYTFSGVDALIADFWADVEEWRSP